MKHYYLSIFLAILLSMACTMTSAHDIAVANSDGKIIYYNYNSDGSSVSVTYQGTDPYSYSNEYTGDVVIPETVTYGGKTYSVTSIGSYAFEYCSGLTSVTIPNSVTNIDNWAFDDCSGLTSVTIPNSVTRIGYAAFSGCSSLASVNIGNSVTSIASCAFCDCSGLTSVTIPNSVTRIGEKAFCDCSGLTSVTIPNSVTSIGSEAFRDCSGLASVTIPNSVTSIGRNAFNGCNGLTSVNIGNSVTSIDYGAFRYCSGLTSVTIPNSVTFIDNDAFDGCSRLKSVTWNAEWCKDFQCGPFDGIATQITQFIIGDNVISIPDRLCRGMSNLTSMTIGNSVSVIGMYAFYGCSRIHSITIPSSVTKIQQYAFEKMHLSTVKILRGIPPTFEFGIEAFDDYHSRLYVPYGSKAKYEAAQYWKKFNIRMLSDSNGDDVVNEIDYSGVASHIMGDTPAEFDAEASDVDVNGTVDVRDYVGIANIISTGSIYGGTSNNAKAAMSKGMAMPATDESDADNVIYVENVSGSKNSQVELSVRMRNASDIRGFQFDLYLPEGVSMATNAKASLSSDRLAAGDAHTLMVNEVSDGAVRFLCSSMNDENFAGGDGEIATLTVNIADNIANGEYDVVVKNALMTETDISKSYEADNIKSTLTVLDQTGVETVTADDERRDGTIYTVGGQLVGKKSTTSQLRKGIYIRNGRKFVK